MNNGKDNDYNMMRQLFGAETDIPESTERRIAEICASLEDKPQSKIYNIFGCSIALSRKAAIAAAAALVFVVCGGTALAAGLIHSHLYQTTLGTGISDNSEDNTYEDALGNTHYYPAFERVEVDEGQAEQEIGAYITTLDRQFKKGGVTLTLMEFVMDENGIGYLSYTVEDPEGIDGTIIRYGSREAEVDPEKGIAPSIIASGDFDGHDSTFVDDRTVINESLSTDKRVSRSDLRRTISA